jgi:hypothetical protein
VHNVNRVLCHNYQENKNADVRDFEVKEFIKQSKSMSWMVIELEILDIQGE